MLLYGKIVYLKVFGVNIIVNFSSPGRQQTTQRTKDKHSKQTTKKDKTHCRVRTKT